MVGYIRQSVTVASLVACLTVSNGQRATWMSDMSTDATYYDFDLYSKTIFEIMWPGSSNAGMYEGSMTSGTNFSSGAYSSELSGQSLSAAENEGWSARQLGSVFEQLSYGSRFLQLQFENTGSDTFVSYSALYGATATSIIADIDAFTTNSDELVILYFSNFIPLTPANKDTELAALWSDFTTTLGSKMATSYTNNQISTNSIQTFIDDGVRIIAFADDTGSGNTAIYEATTFMTSYPRNNTEDISSESSVRSSVVGAIRQGWDVDKMFLLDWTLVTDPSQSVQNYGFNENWFQYSRDLNRDLADVIESFPKLRFGNVILVDYFQTTDCIDEVIRLNWYYDNCNDNNTFWGTDSTDCPNEVNLFNEYSSDGTQSECTNALNTTCARSCGNCPYESGVPGSPCAVSADCDSPIYQSAGGSGSATGRCIITDEEYDDLIAEESFCVSPVAFASCASTADEDVCSGTEPDTSSCSEGCSSNYQCSSGYCSSAYGVCMSFNMSTDTDDNDGGVETDTTSDDITESDTYRFIKSDLADQFLSDIEWMRPGDPDGNFTAEFSNVEDPFQLMDDNPYLTSIIGFILIPFILSLLLFFCWFWICCFWCLPCCEGCCKKCCCRMCLGPSPDDNPVAKWTPCVILGCVTAVIVWACIEGIVYNSSMHEHIFRTYNGTESRSTEQRSVRSELNDLVDDINDKLNGVEPLANQIIDNVTAIAEYITDQINFQEIEDAVDDIQVALKELADDYSGEVKFGTEIGDPFDYSIPTETYEFVCDFCSTISDTVIAINDTVNELVNGGLSSIEDAINASSILNELETEIDSALEEFTTVIDDLINETESIRETANDAFDEIEPYDEQRESGGFVFFITPFIWCVFPILGIFLGKWCFKINWCLAMFLGAAVMLVLSIFAVLTVGWADLCVRLDDFEQNFGKSDVGKQLTSNGLDKNLTGQFYSVVNACFTGESLLAVFGIDEIIDELTETVTEGLDETLEEIDIEQMFENIEVDSFETELDLLDVSTFTDTTTEAIDTLNDWDSADCFCPSVDAVTPTEFTKDLILSYQCSNDRTLNRTHPTNQIDVYWADMFDKANELTADGISANVCINLYTAAYGFAFAEQELLGKMENATQDIVILGTVITEAYEAMVDIAVRFDDVLTQLTCKFDNLFNEFDELIDGYVNCEFIGGAYKGFKKVGCDLLFEDMYHITRSMALIAFLSILIVCCSMCMDYVKDPASGDDDDLDEFGETKGAALGSHTDPYSAPGATGGNVQMTERPSYAAGMGGTMQPGAPEGGGNQTHFV